MKSIALIACLTLSSISAGITVELTPVQDVYICDCQPEVTNPNGNSNYLYHGQFGDCFDRTLIQWDLSVLPDNITILSAEMMLYCEAFWGTQSGCPVYYMISTEWDENTVTFNTQPDYDPSPSITGYWPDPEDWYSVDVLTFVEDWVSGSHSNFGIYCFREGTTGTCVPGFWSSNYSDEALRPRLVIEYQDLSLVSSTWGYLKTLLR